METILTILCVIPGSLLGCLIYILINAKRYVEVYEKHIKYILL